MNYFYPIQVYSYKLYLIFAIGILYYFFKVLKIIAIVTI